MSLNYAVTEVVLFSIVAFKTLDISQGSVNKTTSVTA